MSSRYNSPSRPSQLLNQLLMQFHSGSSNMYRIPTLRLSFLSPALPTISNHGTDLPTPKQLSTPLALRHVFLSHIPQRLNVLQPHYFRPIYFGTPCWTN